MTLQGVLCFTTLNGVVRDYVAKTYQFTPTFLHPRFFKLLCFLYSPFNVRIRIVADCDAKSCHIT